MDTKEGWGQCINMQICKTCDLTCFSSKIPGGQREKGNLSCVPFVVPVMKTQQFLRRRRLFLMLSSTEIFHVGFHKG